MSRSLIYRYLLMAVLGMYVPTLGADTIQLPHGWELVVDFAMPGFNANNPSALFPTTIGLELAGSVPSGSQMAPIPGSSQSYYTGIMLQGSLRSLDGAVALPLFDADAWRLGLAAGSLVAESNGNNSAIIAGEVAVSLNASEAIFGNTGQAEFVIQNDGGDFTIGLGPGYSLSNAILAPLTAANGSVSSAGYLQNLAMSSPSSSAPLDQPVPEPSAIGLAGVGMLALIWFRIRFRP